MVFIWPLSTCFLILFGPSWPAKEYNWEPLAYTMHCWFKCIFFCDVHKFCYFPVKDLLIQNVDLKLIPTSAWHFLKFDLTFRYSSRLWIVTAISLPPFFSSIWGYPGKVKSKSRSSTELPSIVRLSRANCRLAGVWNDGKERNTSFTMLFTICKVAEIS